MGIDPINDNDSYNHFTYDYCEKHHWTGDPYDFKQPHKMFVDPMKNCKDYIKKE